MFEYKTKLYCDVDLMNIDVNKWLNQCGADGWELVAVVRKEMTQQFFFKRKLQ